MNIVFFCTGGGAFLKFVYQNLHILKSIKPHNSTIFAGVGGGKSPFSLR